MNENLLTMNTRDEYQNLDSIKALIKNNLDDKIKSERIDINSINTIKSKTSNKDKIVDNVKYYEEEQREKEKDRNKEKGKEIEEKEKNKRKDLFGNIIKKGSKKHKVVFIDYKGIKKGNLITDIEVESYKKYNEDVSKRHFNENVNCQCSCILF